MSVRTTDEVLDHTMASFPEVRSLIDQAHVAAWAATAPRLLELGRLRIAQLLGDEWELTQRTDGSGVDEATIGELRRWPTAAAFDERDRAALAVTEQWILDVAAMTHDQIRGLADLVGEGETADFLQALQVVEQRQRMRLVFDRLGAGAAAETEQRSPQNSEEQR